MDPLKYQQECARTDVDYEQVIERLQDPLLAQMLHSAIGMATEAGELLDALKRHIYYGKPLDLVNLAEEYGDSFWYAARGIEAIKSDIPTVMDANIRKLRTRFPDRFDSLQALNRDIEQERQTLEQSFQGPVTGSIILPD